jgi:ABC-type phosphate transport system substrate-binding protein
VSLCLIAAAFQSVLAVEIAANPDVPMKQLTRNELQAIFTMRLRTWSNGAAIRVFVLPDSAPLHADFAKEKLSIFPYVLRNYWDRMVFSGTGQFPVELASPAEMRERLADTPGSIGYLPPELIDQRVRALKVINP